ncbi:hypothetical protein Tco_1447486, partial [Tanacetum coccineum]
VVWSGSHPLKNNRSAHLNYISHLKESVEIVREIVEEARVVKPLDNALNYACQYTKLSHELLEYVIGTCPKSFDERDNKAPFTPVTRKKQVTFSDKPGTSSSNTQKHEVHQKVQQTNVHAINSTGVNTSTEASGSKPKSNTKKNRIPPAKTENKKKVEDHPKTNKSVWTKVNRVDSSISSKRVVINSNSESVCKTCNKCLNSASHEMCVVNILNSVNATPTVKIVLNKGKQIWKPKGKLSDNSLNKTKQVWKATGKLFANVGYQWRSTGKKVALGKLNCGYQWRPTGKKFALGELCPLTKLSVQCCSKHMTGNRSKLKNFVEKFIGSVRFGNDHFGAIMGYGDYVIGDSVISRVYYVEGLGHNLFSVGQFCDSDLEVAFRKHSCFVRDINGADLLKGSRRTNLYTISIDDMMKSSPICLLSKASNSHQQVSYFVHARSVVMWINVDQLIGKGNLLLDLQKLQKNPIFCISVDIRQNTNFVRAFTTSANVPSIYIQLFWNALTHDAKTGRSLLHDNIVPKPDLALELGKSISLTEAEEEAVAREVHATHARIVSESEPKPTQRRQSGIAFRDSFIVSKKRSSDSTKKFKGIQTLTPAKQEAADIMKALKESKKMSKRQPGTGGSNEGTGNILGVPDESTVISRASSEGTGSKPGVPDEEKLILEWEADVDSEHFDRDDNAGDDNEETKPDPEEIYK